MRRSTSSCNGLLANSVSTKCIGGDALMGTSTVSALSGASALSKSILDLLARLFEIAGPFVAATFRPEVGIANGASRRLLRSSPQNLEEVLRLIFHRHAEPSSFTYSDIRPWRTLKSPSIIVFPCDVRYERSDYPFVSSWRELVWPWVSTTSRSIVWRPAPTDCRDIPKMIDA